MNKYLYRLIQKTWRLLFKNTYYGIVFYLDNILYEMRKRRIEKNISAKKSINVVFFVINQGMWKNDYLFKLLLQDERFKPLVVFFPLPSDTRERQIELQKGVESYFINKGYPYKNGFDFEHNSFYDFKGFPPDIVFYAQPYRNGYKAFDLKQFWKESLFIYIPYCILMEKGDRFCNTLYQNIAWKVFLPTHDEKMLYNDCFSKGKNCIVTGSPVADYICSDEKLSDDIWKGDGVKNIIWAPHHSVLETDTLNYSNFLDIADKMIEVAKQYNGVVNFAFKPHPMLKNKLYSLHSWGKEKTDAYYNKWKTMPNTIMCEDSYYDLFRSSDGMIHDCSSFTAEYLYTEKPVFYFSKSDHVSFLNDFGIKCFNLHYKGGKVEDICSFIDNVIINGQDLMHDARVAFKNKYLLPIGGSAAMNMFSEINNHI